MLYERLLEKYKNDPTYYEDAKYVKLVNQRKRFEDPEVREKHRLACLATKNKKKQGLPIRPRKIRAPLKETPIQDFVCSFD
jgi:hypothetical protein